MDTAIRVILNDRVLMQTLTGVGHYVNQLLPALRRVAPDVNIDPCLTSYWKPAATKPAAAEAPASVIGSRESGAAPKAPPPRPKHDLRRYWSVRQAAQKAYAALLRLRAWGHDLYHEPNHIPVRCGLPTVTTLHDLSVLLFPDWHPADRVRWYEREFERGRRQTTRFIAVSEFTKRELVERLNIPADKIDVTYQAARPAFAPQPAAAVLAARAALELPEQFFLFVGTLEPRKNVIGLLEAYVGLPPALRRRCPLVIAGGWGWNTERLRERLDTLVRDADIRLLGYTGDDVLARLYTGCTALVWPSLYEGFGLPPLEALACGAPVIVSNVTSLPEVVGDAGVLLDPARTGAWTEALRRMAEDAAWRENWSRRGVARAGRFSWEQCARDTVACFRRTLGQPP